ncbi:hypothetical protein [Streptomyces sp. NPDC054940]
MTSRERKLWALAFVFMLSVVVAEAAAIVMTGASAEPIACVTAVSAAFAASLTLGLGVLKYLFAADDEHSSS